MTVAASPPMAPPHVTKVRPGDVLISEGTAPWAGKAGTEWQLFLGAGSHVRIRCAGHERDLATTPDGFVIGLTRKPLEEY